MFARISLFFNCFILVFVSFSSAQAATFLESGGKVVIEAESSSATGQWSRQSKIGGAKGGSYLIWNGPDLFAGSAAGRDTIRYTFRIQQAGNYELRWRSYIGHGNNATEANDSWVRFPTGKNINGQHGLNGWTKVFQNQANQWSWSAKTVDHVGKSVRQYFSKGDHVMEISGRSHGHAIDRMVLFRYADISYSQSKFDGYPASSTVGGSQPPQNDDSDTQAEEEAKAKAEAEAKAKAEAEAKAKAEAEAAAKAKAEADAKAQAEADAKAQAEADAKAQAEAEAAAQAEAQAEAEARAEVEAQAEAERQAQTPVVTVNGNTLSWNAVNARAINVHNQDGQWLESISGTSTEWNAPSAGSYFIVATNDQGWETWARSNTVDVVVGGATSSNGEAGSNSILTNLNGVVYSSTAGELFWSVEGDMSRFQFELLKNSELAFSGSALSYFDDALSPGSQYEYQLTVLENGQVVAQQSTSISTQSTSGATGNQVAANASVSPVQLRGEVYSQSAVELRWDRSTHADAAAFTYNLYQDDQLITNTDALSYYIDGLSAGSTYRFTLKAQDVNGSEGDGYSISLTTHSADGSSVASFGQPAESVRYGSALWNSLPGATQQLLPSDCSLAQSATNIVYCHSERDDRLLARNIESGESQWSYSLNTDRTVSVLEVIGANRLMMVSNTDNCLDCARFTSEVFNVDGSLASTANPFADQPGSVAHGVDGSGVRFARSSTGNSAFLAAKRYSAIDGANTGDASGWFETGVSIVELDSQNNTVLNIRVIEGADFATVVLADK